MVAHRATIAVLATLAWVGPAAAFPVPPPGVQGPAVGLATALPELRRALAAHLAPAEIDRLLARPEVNASLTALFEGWDGSADRLAVSASAGSLRLEVALGYRRCVVGLTAPEGQPPEPVCHDASLPNATRKLEVSSDRWAPPRPPASPPKAALHARPAAKIARPEPALAAEPPPSIMRDAHPAHAEASGPEAIVDAALAAHDELRARIRRPHWKDPLLPTNLLETGTALAPLPENPPIVEEAVAYHLKNPFDEARMRTELPVADLLTLGVEVREPLVPTDRDECIQAWSDRENASEPPTLDCFRRTSWNKMLARDTGYQVVDFLAKYLQVPIIAELRDLLAKDTTSDTGHRLVWAMVFLDWLRLHPERQASALAALDLEERRSLRRRVAELWVKRELADYRPTLTSMLESHFLLLYPEAKDLDGFPRRAFFPDQWLWATNWLAGASGREDALVLSAYGKLGVDERRLLAALVSDPRFAGRFERVSAVVRATLRSREL